MKITSLVDNFSEMPGISSEHGLSLYIETGSHKILFDMGQGTLFAENALKLDNYDTAYYTCHCTGASQFEYMRSFSGKIHYLSAGQTIGM